jgi:hypothetical protein
MLYARKLPVDRSFPDFVERIRSPITKAVKIVPGVNRQLSTGDVVGVGLRSHKNFQIIYLLLVVFPSVLSHWKHAGRLRQCSNQLDLKPSRLCPETPFAVTEFSWTQTTRSWSNDTEPEVAASMTMYYEKLCD